jgi:lysophospholipase L1-like esterase
MSLVALVLAGAPTVSATDENAEPLKVVAIGDSIGFGLWDTRGGYARRYVSLLESSGHTVQFTNLSVPGWETGDLRDAVATSRLFRAVIRDADIVLGEIGGNDLDRLRSAYKTSCAVPDVSAAVSNAGAIARDVTTLLEQDGKPGELLTFTLYNPYVDQDRGTRSCNDEDDLDVLNAQLQEYNAAIEAAGDRDLVTAVDVYEAFNISRLGNVIDPARKWYLAFDDFHPNFRGHQKIADLLFGATS